MRHSTTITQRSPRAKVAITFEIALLLAGLSLVGCTTTQQGMGIGAATGGLAGGIIGHQSGNTAAGTAIGAGAGAVAGGLIGERLDTLYCPECGRRFKGGREYCPYDGERLRAISR